MEYLQGTQQVCLSNFVNYYKLGKARFFDNFDTNIASYMQLTMLVNNNHPFFRSPQTQLHQVVLRVMAMVTDLFF